ncbi:FAD-binding protein [Chitinophaga vietnamensis]|uniref:FAD-binding protein n=1 Tax=Chitinophaga vietnamensis TaxID=2593957 RepID=UPI00191C50C4|nr:FAD-binding protein [Chitinophaga vietnamensis]
MQLKQQLPVSYLLFTTRGRINRRTYWIVSLFIVTTFYILYTALNAALGAGATWALYPLLYWSLAATAAKRLHDSNLSGNWLLVVLLPVAGPLLLGFLLLLKRGNKGNNRYGFPAGVAADYLVNDNGQAIPGINEARIINDVTQLNPVQVSYVMKPATVADLCDIVKRTSGKVSVGGGRFSMGGQTASTGSMHIDMRHLNKVIAFSKEDRTITVEAGIRWCDIQHYIDPENLSIKIMQTYANFTVGGALSVNAHGRYIGSGPLILSVLSIDVVLADGSLVHAGPHTNPEIFYGAIGGYNALGIIAQVTLVLTDNTAVKRSHKKMQASAYPLFFRQEVRDNSGVVFHNGDLYPPKFTHIRAVSWKQTSERPNEKQRLMPLKDAYPLERYFFWVFSERPLGKWYREHLIEPLLYLKKKIHWRNYEAGYDVAELEPRSRKKSTYVLQEYFVPVQQFDAFNAAMGAVFQRYGVNVINVSVRHALPDPGSYLAWAREEVFAFVVYYKQDTSAVARNKVAIWTRELIDAAIAAGGTYYLPYQPHATAAQFHQAYPRAEELFSLKRKLDPHFRFSHVLWDKYYKP